MISCKITCGPGRSLRYAHYGLATRVDPSKSCLFHFQIWWFWFFKKKIEKCSAQFRVSRRSVQMDVKEGKKNWFLRMKGVRWLQSAPSAGAAFPLKHLWTSLAELLLLLIRVNALEWVAVVWESTRGRRCQMDGWTNGWMADSNFASCRPGGMGGAGAASILSIPASHFGRNPLGPLLVSIFSFPFN